MRHILLLAFVLAWTPALAAPEDVGADLETVRAEIQATKEALSGYSNPSAAIPTTLQLKLATLEATEALLSQRVIVEREAIPTEIKAAVAQPSPEIANQIAEELKREEGKLAELKTEARRYTGGLLQATSALSAAAQETTVAFLRMKYYEAKYGLWQPAPATQASAGTDASSVDQDLPDSPAAAKAEPPKWADPDYPDIDYTAAYYSGLSQNEGTYFSGRWTVVISSAGVDDSRTVIAFNADPQDTNQSDTVTAYAGCVEGSTRFLVSTGGYLLDNDDRLRVTWRIGADEAVQESWYSTTNNHSAIIEGRQAREFIERLAKANPDRLFLRVDERDGDRHSKTLDARGFDKVRNEIGDACNWLGDDMTAQQRQAVQQALKAAGFYKGSIDGRLGGGSRAAIISYQKSKDLTITGGINRQTAMAMGLITE